MLKDYDLSKVPEVHFCNDNSDLAYVVNSTLNSDNTSITAKVPNKLLEESLPLYCYIYLTDSTDETSMKTIVYVELPVKKRKKPDDYHYEDDSDVISLRDRVSKLETYAHTIVAGFIPMFSEDGVNGLNWSIYRWADGTTTFDKIKQNPDLAGTEILIGTSVYKYSNAIVGDDGVVPFGCGHLEFQRMIEGTEDGVINNKGHHLPCGYAAIKGRDSETFNSLTLYDENENVIQADSDGDLEQCAILYDESYSVKGFKIDKNTKKAYLSDYAVKSGTTQNATGGVILSNNGCVASGKDSVSGGDNCTASGDCSVSLGRSNDIKGYASSAIGADNIVEGYFSNAFGNQNHFYNGGNFSFAFGLSNNIYENFSLASGTQNTLGDSDASSAFMCSFGSGNENHGGYIYSFGAGNTAGETTPSHNSNHIFAVGSNLKVLGDYSFAFGTNSSGKTTVSSSASNSFVFGSNNQAYSQYSIIFGDGNTTGIQPTDDTPNPSEPPYSVAIGAGCTSKGYISLALGQNCMASGSMSVAMGVLCRADSTMPSYALGHDCESDGQLSLALGQQAYIKGKKTIASFALGQTVNVYSSQSLALGGGCIAGTAPTDDTPNPTQGQGNVAMGGGCQATKDCSFALGSGCKSYGGAAFAMGGGSTAYGSNSFALSAAISYGDNSFAFGGGCKSYGVHSFACGTGAESYGDDSFAFGYNVLTRQQSQFAIGKYNTDDQNGKFAFAIGNGNYDAETKTTTRSNAIAVDWQGKIYVNNSDTGVDVLDLLNRVKALEAAVSKLS